jgi:hypothetical protein
MRRDIRSSDERCRDDGAEPITPTLFFAAYATPLIFFPEKIFVKMTPLMSIAVTLSLRRLFLFDVFT